jgi:hypothetical protein
MFLDNPRQNQGGGGETRQIIEEKKRWLLYKPVYVLGGNQ